MQRINTIAFRNRKIMTERPCLKSPFHFGRDVNEGLSKVPDNVSNGRLSGTVEGSRLTG